MGSKKSSKKRSVELYFAVVSMSLLLSFVFYMCFNNWKVPLLQYNDVNSISSSDTGSSASYVSVGELWDEENNIINTENLDTLMGYLSVDGDVNNIPVTGGLDSVNTADIKNYTYGGKTAGKSIVIRLGGLDWLVTYLSSDVNSNVIVTLWLSNNLQQGFAGRMANEGAFYGFLQNSTTGLYGMYSDFSANWYGDRYDTASAYPTTLYGTSYIRSVTLNNGGTFLKGVDGTTDDNPTEYSFTPTSNSVFAPFTVDNTAVAGDYDSITDYIVTPNQVSWQVDSQGSNFNVGYILNNESLTVGSNYSGSDWSDRVGYANWGSDKLWLPSLSETGYSDTSSRQGIWGLTDTERASYDGSTTSILGSIGGGTSGTLTGSTGNAYGHSWTRSAYLDNPRCGYPIEVTGNGTGDYLIHSSLAVRPALHLNLSLIVAVSESQNSVNVAELWDSGAQEFNNDNLQILYNYLSGKSNATLADIDALALANTNATTLRQTSITSGVTSGGVAYRTKQSGDSIVVRLGGLDWYVTYVSKDKSGNTIATLWLDNNLQEGFGARVVNEGDYYGYLQEPSTGLYGLYSDWSANWYDSGVYDGSCPSNLYGVSYIRAVTLNNGGNYIQGVSGQNNSSTYYYAPSASSAFAIYTMSSINGVANNLVDYITSPNAMPWQMNSQGTQNAAGVLLNNEALLSGASADGAGANDYINNKYYDDWGNDKVWLPSFSEIGYSDALSMQGIWSLSDLERANYDGTTTSIIGTGGNVSGSTYAHYWVRSAFNDNTRKAFLVQSTGNSYGSNGTFNSFAVRPALHLNLTAISTPSISNYQFQDVDDSGNPVIYTVSSVGSLASVVSVEMTGASSLTIPETFTYNGWLYTITSLADSSSNATSVFYPSISYLTGVTMPNTIRRIGDFAFASCTNLNNITIPSSVTSIGTSAFKRAGLVEVNIDARFANIADIGSDAFAQNSSSVIYWFADTNEHSWQIARNAYYADTNKFTSSDNGQNIKLERHIYIEYLYGEEQDIKVGKGDSVTITPTPQLDERFVFASWVDASTNNIVSSNANYTFVVDENVSLKVHFAFAYSTLEIGHVAQLFWLADRVADYIDFAGVTINLTNNLDLTGVTDQVWESIGLSSDFKGTINGNGYAIIYNANENAIINGGTSLHGENITLFSSTITGIVKNIILVGDITAGVDVVDELGGLVFDDDNALDLSNSEENMTSIPR